MARSLPAALDLLQIHPQRRPRWKVEIFDVRSSVADTMGRIVRSVDDATIVLEAITGPRDFTSDTVSVQISESAGNFVDSGIPTTNVVLTVADPNGLFDYFNLFADPTGDGRWLRRDNVLRISEGDADVPEADWPITFTGFLVGQAGVDRNRTTGNALITIEAVGRESRFVKSKKTSEVFGTGDTYIGAANTIATTDMGLDSSEVDFSGWGTQTFGHSVTQLVDQEPMISLAQLMLADGFMPKFTGAGILTQIQGLVTASPARIYSNNNIIRSVVQPFSNENPVNQVCVVGLSADMTKISQPKQEVGRVSLTTGYFASDETIKVFWSDDKTQLVDNIDFEIERSINGGLSAFGTESFDSIPTPESGEGTIGGAISISTGFAPYLIVILTVAYIASAWIVDEIVTVGFVAGSGVTIPIGRVAQAAILIGALLAMAQIGRAVYRIDGTPFEYVFEEIRACAELEGLLSEDIVAAEIENHLINDQTTADNVARDVLFRQQARGRPRNISMLFDLRVEPDDTIELASGRTYLIDGISRTLVRSTEEVPASLRAFETTAGIGALV